MKEKNKVKHQERVLNNHQIPVQPQRKRGKAYAHVSSKPRALGKGCVPIFLLILNAFCVEICNIHSRHKNKC